MKRLCWIDSFYCRDGRFLSEIRCNEEGLLRLQRIQWVFDDIRTEMMEVEGVSQSYHMFVLEENIYGGIRPTHYRQ